MFPSMKLMRGPQILCSVYIVIISGEIDRNFTLRVSTGDSTAVAGGILHFLCSSITTMQKNSSDVVMFSNIAQAIDLTHKI